MKGQLSGLLHRSKAWDVLARIIQISEAPSNVDAVFLATLRLINSELNMHRSVILWRDEQAAAPAFRPCWSHGFEGKAQQRLPTLAFGLSMLLTPDAVLLVNAASPRTAEVGGLCENLAMRYLVGTPIRHTRQVHGWLISGREREQWPASPRLSRADVAILAAIVGVLAAVHRQAWLTEQHLRAKEQLAAGAHRWRTEVAGRTGQLIARNRALARRNAALARGHRQARKEKIAAQAAEEQAQLAVLRYQLQPHFLLNAFNSLYGLIYPLSRAAGELVQRLADFCRLVLVRNGELQPLREEIRLLRIYLEIERTRWRDRMQIEIETEESALDALLPPWLLLPLVENAIKYGLATSHGPVGIRLIARRSAADLLVIEVANTGEWHPGTTASPRIGLENLQARLRRYAPDTHSFRIVADGGWVVATLQLALPSPGRATAPPAPPPG